MEKYIKYLPAFLVTILTIRLTIFGASVGEAIALASLAALLGYKDWLATKEIKNPTKEIETKVQEIKDEMSKLSMSVSQKPPVNLNRNKFQF